MHTGLHNNITVVLLGSPHTHTQSHSCTQACTTISLLCCSVRPMHTRNLTHAHRPAQQYHCCAARFVPYTHAISLMHTGLHSNITVVLLGSSYTHTQSHSCTQACTTVSLLCCSVRPIHTRNLTHAHRPAQQCYRLYQWFAKNVCTMTPFAQNVFLTTPIPTDSKITTIYFNINDSRIIRLYLK